MIEGMIAKQTVIEAIADLLCKVGTAQTVDDGDCGSCKYFGRGIGESPCNHCRNSYLSFYEREDHGKES